MLKKFLDYIANHGFIYILIIFFAEQFNRLDNTVSSMRNSHVRSVRVAVAVFLAKLRLGLSNRVLAVLFNLENKRVVSHINNQVRKALMKSFVPYHLGLKHITRETAIE